jgi:hypothetical protein
MPAAARTPTVLRPTAMAPPGTPVPLGEAAELVAAIVPVTPPEGLGRGPPVALPARAMALALYASWLVTLPSGVLPLSGLIENTMPAWQWLLGLYDLVRMATLLII